MDALKHLEVNLGQLCNGRCVFCISAQAKSPAWAPKRRIRAEILNAYRRGSRSLGLLGGEPTAYPDIEGIVAHARAIGFRRISLASNGLLLADPEFARRLAVAGVSRITVSVHSPRADLEEALTGVAGAFEKKVLAIQNLVRLQGEGHFRDNVSLNAVLSRPLLDVLDDYVAFFSRLGISDMRFNALWPNGTMRDAHALVPRYREVALAALRLIRGHRGRSLRLSFGGLPFCAIPRDLRRWPLFVAEYFQEDPKRRESILIFRSRQGSFRRCDGQDRPDPTFKRKRWRFCSRCAYGGDCSGVYESYLKLYGAGEFSRSGPGCSMGD